MKSNGQSSLAVRILVMALLVTLTTQYTLYNSDDYQPYDRYQTYNTRQYDRNRNSYGNDRNNNQWYPSNYDDRHSVDRSNGQQYNSGYDTDQQSRNSYGNGQSVGAYRNGYRDYKQTTTPEPCDYTRTSDVGRKCSTSCDSDYDCLGDLVCKCDGKCGRSCINTKKRCFPNPQDIQNGKVKVSGLSFGGVAEYSCNAGYMLVGLPARVCQGDETWSGEPPRCELDHGMLDDQEYCTYAPDVSNGHHNGQRGQTRFEKGTTLRFKCNAGYLEQNDSAVSLAICVGGGTWIGPRIECVSKARGCERPEDIENGRADVLTTNGMIAEGQVVTYACQQGFYIIGESTRTCQRDGQWSGDEPSCAKVACGPPPMVEHATHDAPDGQRSFKGGFQILYSCKFGFYGSGSQRAICNGREGSWDGPKMSCTARDCQDPGEISNGWRDPGYKFTHPTRITYHCNQGYEMEGRPYRDCGPNGMWSGQIPLCKPVNCTDLGPPQHGTMANTDIKFGSVRNFTCGDGYKLIGSRERTCQADGTWSGRETICEEVSCGPPGPLYNGYLDGHRTTAGAIYFFRCNVRTKFYGKSVSTRCNDTGQWSEPLPQCLGQCQVTGIGNGTLNNGRVGMWVDHDHQLSVNCQNGLVLNDSRPIRCNNGTWTILPKCVPAPCNAPPPLIENGHRVFFDLSHGSKARYYCMAGYALANKAHKYLTCEYSKWKGAQPRCKEDHCPNPGVLKDGKIYKLGSHGKFEFHDYISIIKHGDRLVYECKRLYKLVGPPGAACVNGAWSPAKKPECHRARHPRFNKLWKPHQAAAPARMYYR